MDLDPSSNNLSLHEQTLVDNLSKAYLSKAGMYRQKCRIKWDEERDKNSAFYHSFLKARHAKAKIHTIQDMQGEVHTSQQGISEAFVAESLMHIQLCI